MYPYPSQVRVFTIILRPEPSRQDLQEVMMRSNVQAVSACCNRNQALSARQWMILGLAFVAWGFILSAGQALGQAEGYKSLPLNAEFVSPPDSGEPKDRRAESARRQRYSERLRLVNDIYKGST